MSTSQFKFVLAGSAFAGKSCLVQRLLFNNWIDVPQQPTLSVAYNYHQFSKGNETVEISIWDTCGGEKFSTIVATYLRGVDVAMLCFCQHDSHTNLTSCLPWISRIKELSPDAVIIAIATKLDESPLNVDEIKPILEQHNISLFYQTSAKTGFGCAELLKKMKDLAFTLQSNLSNKNDEGIVDIYSNNSRPNNGCNC
ncbi:hypothetical protein RCL1_001241 [Eukaryota sp. TZLM3-RCL]